MAVFDVSRSSGGSKIFPQEGRGVHHLAVAATRVAAQSMTLLVGKGRDESAVRG